MADHPMPTPAADLSPEEWASEVEIAQAIHERVVAAGRTGRKAAWVLANALYEAQEHRIWNALGYETKGEWLAQPEVSITRSTFDRMVRVWRETHVMRTLDAPTLEQVEVLDVAKVDIVLPAVNTGKIKLEKGLDDVEALGARDLREKYVPRPAPAPSTDGKAAEPVPEPATDDEGPDDVPSPSGAPEVLTGALVASEGLLPERIGLCPEHYDHFYLPLSEGDSRNCPEPGCDQVLVVYVREAVDAS